MLIAGCDFDQEPNEVGSAHRSAPFRLIGIWFFARPLVLDAARVKENWLLGLTKHSAIFMEQGRNVNRQFLQILAGLQSLIGRGREASS